jgi:D-serine deaminase-like pyridoxal phosphate-dependent protein
LDDFKAVVDAILASKNLRLGGVMAYEAQIAGVTDKNPFQSLLNYPIRMMKRLSMADVKQKRLAAAQYLTEKRITVDFFNGGGTGSLEDASSESCLTEVTAGSGFLQSTLFDYYESNRNEPAMAMALRVTREPSAGVITCHSGGFISRYESLCSSE